MVKESNEDSVLHAFSKSGGGKRVTIGVCTKNNASTVTDTLESILKLNYSPSLLELIIVDGLSSDETLLLAKRILNKRKLDWRLLDDGGRGLGCARQILTEHAKGKFIAFIDADQSIDSDWLKTTLRFLAVHPDVAGVRGRQGLTTGLPLPSALENYSKFIEDKEVDVESRVDNFALGGSLFRKQAILDVGGFDHSINVSSEDTDLAERLKQRGWKIYNLKQAVFYHTPRTSWRLLYRQYNNWGRNTAAIQEKRGYSLSGLNGFKVLKESISLLVQSSKYAFQAFGSSKDLRCIFLPVHYAYKRAAFASGFFFANKKQVSAVNC